VKEGHVQRAAPAQDTERIGGQVGCRVGGVAGVLGDGGQGPQPRENEVEDGQGVIAAIADKVLAAPGQLRVFVASLFQQRLGQGTILGIAAAKDQGEGQLALEVHDPDQAVAQLKRVYSKLVRTIRRPASAAVRCVE
jgi:hypothetical protein